MKPARLSLVFAPFAVLCLLAPIAHAASVEGDWLTPKGGGKVHIAACGAKLCGTITWLRRATDKAGQPLKDSVNPDPALRTRPVVGMTILRNFKPAGADRWGGGSIYNPGDGKTYDSKLSINPDGTLKVDGCIAVFCVAQTWTRAQ